MVPSSLLFSSFWALVPQLLTGCHSTGIFPPLPSAYFPNMHTSFAGRLSDLEGKAKFYIDHTEGGGRPYRGGLAVN